MTVGSLVIRHLARRQASGAAAGGFLRRLIRTRGSLFGLVVLTIVAVLAATAGLIAPYNPNKTIASILQAPGAHCWLGTDHLGRDVLSRLLYGTRVAVLAGAVSVGLAVVLGVVIGLVAGTRGGWVDDVLMRVVDALWAIPT